MREPVLFFLSAGEQSGDVLGSRLIHSLKTRNPHIRFKGIGGPQMRHEGLECIVTMEHLHVMGFTGVLASLPRLRRAFKQMRNAILTHKPNAVIFIDYPEFHMLLAGSLRKKGYGGKLIHYVCPSVWAWRKKRITALAKRLDLLLSILPFEPSLFSQTSLNVAYIGHPLVAMLQSHCYDPLWGGRFSLTDDRPCLGIFPGSRKQEIQLNLPLQLKAAKEFLNQHPEFTCAISAARPQLEKDISHSVKQASIPAVVVPGEHRYELMRKSSLALATSGTVILELGLHETPTVATYKIASLNYLLGRYVFRIHLPFYTLVNILAKKEVFPEFIHRTLSYSDIATALCRLLDTKQACQKHCSDVKKMLSLQDASETAAQKIIEITLG